MADDLEFGRGEGRDPAETLERRDRRTFMQTTALAAAGAFAGLTVPSGLVPAAVAQEDPLAGKEGLTLLGDRPVNAEAPAHLLDDPITPTDRHVIRNSGLLPFEMDHHRRRRRRPDDHDHRRAAREFRGRHPGAWQNWRTTLSFPQAGYCEISARATDSKGVSQPRAISWNPRGYLNNTFHRVGVMVG